MDVRRANPWKPKPKNFCEAQAIDFGDSCLFNRRVWMRARGTTPVPLFMDLSSGALVKIPANEKVERVKTEIVAS